MTPTAPSRRRVVSFEPVHAERIESQEKQRWSEDALHYGPDFWEAMLCRSEAITMLRGERVISTGGVTVLDGAPAPVSWAYFSAHAGPADMLYAFRAARAWLAEVAERYGMAEIRTVADAEFPEAQRWLKMLGYECVGWLPNHAFGRDAWLYIRYFGSGDDDG